MNNLTTMTPLKMSHSGNWLLTEKATDRASLRKNLVNNPEKKPVEIIKYIAIESDFFPLLWATFLNLL